ncbi:MAG: hypothetical protein ACI85K_000835 [Hyphomicrobiaceae bacterium]|jgi:hypothetical protein
MVSRSATAPSFAATAPMQLGEGVKSLQVRRQSALGKQRDYAVVVTRPVASAFLKQA